MTPANDNQHNTLTVLDLFSAAAGGWSLGMHRAGFRTIAACEVIPWRRAVYSENNPGVPVYDDVTTLTADRLVRDGVGLPWAIVGSPPCQDISPANTKGKGVDGARSGLYFEAIRLVRECRPRWFAFENSANLRTRGADRVIPELEAIGYTVWPFVVRAGDVGANHERARSWLVGFQTGDAAKDGCGPWGPGRRSEPVAGLSEQACGDANATGQRHESGRPRRHGPHGYGTPPVAEGLGSPANTNQARQPHGQVEPGLRETPQPFSGCDDGRRRQVFSGPAPLPATEHREMGGSTGPCPDPAEPWADWNGGLTHHLQLDDGLSSWVAGTRVAVGGPKGTSAASLIVEAFGDAVIPQIPEAIGRAILRVEAALAAIHHCRLAA